MVSAFPSEFMFLPQRTAISILIRDIIAVPAFLALVKIVFDVIDDTMSGIKRDIDSRIAHGRIGVPVSLFSTALIRDF